MDKATVNEIIEFLKLSLIHHNINVESIILFGSALHGTMDEDSDIDLIIISSDFRSLDIFERATLTMKSETATIRKYKIPLDVISLCSEEYTESNLRFFHQTKIVA